MVKIKEFAFLGNAAEEVLHVLQWCKISDRIKIRCKRYVITFLASNANLSFGMKALEHITLGML